MSIYDVNDLSGILSANSYPGRGIVLGKSADGKSAVFAYFIMGRSENSRNRIFRERRMSSSSIPTTRARFPTPPSSSIRR